MNEPSNSFIVQLREPNIQIPFYVFGMGSAKDLLVFFRRPSQAHKKEFRFSVQKKTSGKEGRKLQVKLCKRLAVLKNDDDLVNSVVDDLTDNVHNNENISNCYTSYIVGLKFLEN